MIFFRPRSPSLASLVKCGITTVSSCRMIDALMYGMMPSAKIVSREGPAGKDIKKPKKRAALVQQELAEFVVVDARGRDVRADPIDRQHPEREQNPVPQLRNIEDVLEIRDQPLKHRREPLPSPLR